MKPVVWKPTSAQIKSAHVTQFMKKHEIATVDDLVRRSQQAIEWFWNASVQSTDIRWFEPYLHVLDDSQGMPFCKWFVGGRLNMAYNCVDRHSEDKKKKNLPAVKWQGECGAVVEWNYQKLRLEVDRVAQFLLNEGIKAGDRVGLYMPMIPELLSIFFGVLKVGGILVPVFSGFAEEATLARFQDADVKFVFTADGTLRKGKSLALKKNLDRVLKACPQIKKCIVVKRLYDEKTPMTAGRDVFYQDLEDAKEPVLSLELASEQPALLIYTSGTTGKPKGTVHTHAGTLAQVTKEFYFNFNFKPKDSFFWVTDIGWMMGPWEIIGSTHFAGSVVLIEGAPLHPKNDRIFKLCEKFKVTHLGVSPTLIRLCMNETTLKMARYPLKKLRYIGSTGELWDDESYLWCFKKIGKSKRPIINISGGTELMGCLLAPLPVKEIKQTSLQSSCLGMAVDVWDENGNSVPAGDVGYLVVKKPAPSMTRGFYNDKTRYLETYFSKFKDVWNHGDWAYRDSQGHWYLRGRADDTLKISGKRVGPAEIESVLCHDESVAEATAIGVPDALKGEALVCFVVLKEGVKISKALKARLEDNLIQSMGSLFRPQEIYAVKALPKTRSGKIVRGAIKKYYLGDVNLDTSSLENPETLKLIPQLKN